MKRPKVPAWLVLLVLPAFTAEADAQMPAVLPAGSTPQGDILRGEGVYLTGAGIFNYYSAMGNSINTDTMIRLNEYIYQSIKQENLEKAQHRAAVLAKRRENFEKILDRVKNHPEQYDLEKGDALNSLAELLLAPEIHSSSFRLSPVLLDGATVRTIPFFYAPESTVISMTRVTPGAKWPVGLRGDSFANERRAYDVALENTLDLQNEGKLSRDSIDKLGGAIDGLLTKLNMVVKPSRNKDYVEAEIFLKRLENWKSQLRKQKVEQIVGEIEKYSGTTVHDLVLFMQRNGLRFGVPEGGNERELYPSLFAKLQQQLDTVKNSRPPTDQ